MSTHSTIGLEHEDGTITAIYCHWDGRIEHNGRILVDHYGDVERVMQLLALGNLSELGEEIGQAHDFRTHGLEHPTWCLAYERDRGDVDCMPQVYPNEAIYLEAAECEHDAANVFLFRGGSWYAYSGQRAAWYDVQAALRAAARGKE
jgi:hypothetical protein